MKYLSLVFVLVIFITGCTQSGYKKFYKPYVDTKSLTDVVLLEKNQEPQVFGTDNFTQDIQTLRSKGYILIGDSSFNGRYEDTGNAAEQAKRIGASIVLVGSQYTNTQTTTSTLFLPDNKITHHSGTINSNTTYNSVSSGYLGKSNTSSSYRGTSTTYGTKAIPITSSQRLYNQKAIYFVKSTKKLRFGVALSNLTPKKRIQLERNMGALVDALRENSPAFNSNLLVGDVLIAVDGNLVKNANQASNLMKKVSLEASSSTFTVIRNGVEKNILIQF